MTVPTPPVKDKAHGKSRLHSQTASKPADVAKASNGHASNATSHTIFSASSSSSLMKDRISRSDTVENRVNIKRGPDAPLAKPGPAKQAATASTSVTKQIVLCYTTAWKVARTKDLESICLAHGAEFRDHLDDTVTHLIAKTEGLEKGLKFRKCQTYFVS